MKIKWLIKCVDNYVFQYHFRFTQKMVISDTMPVNNTPRNTPSKALCCKLSNRA